MFRDMRRKTQMLLEQEIFAVLARGSSGVLAVNGDNGYPYAVPLSYAHDQGKIFFHCATVGHKLDAIINSAKVSFCVIDADEVVPQEYTTYFRSVIAFGTARVLEEESEKRAALEFFATKYSPHHVAGRQKEIENQFTRVTMVKMTVEHITGKEAIELVRKKRHSASN